LYGTEEGWVFGLERVASQTANTVYDPAEDKALELATTSARKYSKSPIPKGSWRVRLPKGTECGPKEHPGWITMDAAMFAYDVWFEENQVFQYLSWLGVFVQQDPADAMVIQQMLWREKPDLVVEVGTNTGGGAVFYASIMRNYNANAKVVTLDVKEVSNWNTRNNHRCDGCVLGTESSYWKDGSIHFIKGRVTEAATRAKVEEFVRAATKVIVIEDASHRYPDTLENMEAIHQWVSPGTYMLVQDTKMDRFVDAMGKKYGRLKFGPMRSVDEFLKRHPNFVIDRRFEYLLSSQHHRGWLRRTS
jgi:cephalosporin hydroxylase